MRFFRLTFKCFVDCFWISFVTGSNWLRRPVKFSISRLCWGVPTRDKPEQTLIWKKKKREKEKKDSCLFCFFVFKKREIPKLNSEDVKDKRSTAYCLSARRAPLQARHIFKNLSTPWLQPTTHSEKKKHQTTCHLSWKGPAQVRMTNEQCFTYSLSFTARFNHLLNGMLMN